MDPERMDWKAFQLANPVGYARAVYLAHLGLDTPVIEALSHGGALHAESHLQRLMVTELLETLRKNGFSVTGDYENSIAVRNHRDGKVTVNVAAEYNVSIDVIDWRITGVHTTVFAWLEEFSFFVDANPVLQEMWYPLILATAGVN